MWDGASKIGVGIGKVAQPQPASPEIVYKLYEVSDGLALKPVHGGGAR